MFSCLKSVIPAPAFARVNSSWNPEVVDLKGTGFPIKNFGNDIFRLLQEPQEF
jgi:hypothetical protein